MEFAVPGLAGLRLELTPEHMSEGRFWKLYFVMIAGKLQEEETEVLLSEEVSQGLRAKVLSFFLGHFFVYNVELTLFGDFFA